jgi:predicted ATPase
MRNIQSLRESAEGARALSEEHHLRLWSSWATVLRGWALAEAGAPDVGIAELQRGDDQMRAIGSLFLLPFVSSLLVEQFAKTGQIERGLGLANETLASTRDYGYWYDAELERLRGDLLLAGDIAGQAAEVAYRRAIQIARKQRARLFELRAATSLARLWINQGRSADSRELLARCYGWFTEGLELPDLKNAEALLDLSLSDASSQ